jgi:hypothetical protein
MITHAMNGRNAVNAASVVNVLQLGMTMISHD